MIYSIFIYFLLFYFIGLMDLSSHHNGYSNATSPAVGYSNSPSPNLSNASTSPLHQGSPDSGIGLGKNISPTALTRPAGMSLNHQVGITQI